MRKLVEAAVAVVVLVSDVPKTVFASSGTSSLRRHSPAIGRSAAKGRFGHIKLQQACVCRLVFET